MPSGTIAVALEAQDEQGLRELQSTLKASQIPHIPIVEGEGSYEGQLMAIGVEPTQDRTAIRRITGSLPLVK
jgi:hypothetical protein